MARNNNRSTSSSFFVAACVAFVQWLVFIMIATVKRAVRFVCCVASSSSAASPFVSECDLEAGGIVAAESAEEEEEEEEAVASDEEEQDETEAFETIDVIVITETMMLKPNEDDSWEGGIEIVVVEDESTGASKSRVEQDKNAEALVTSALAVSVDAVIITTETKSRDEAESDDWTPTNHSAWDSEDDEDCAADTQVDSDLETVSHASSCSSPVSSSFATPEDDQEVSEAPRTMMDNKRIDIEEEEEAPSRVQQQQEQEQEEEDVGETDDSSDDDDDNESSPVDLDADDNSEQQQQHDDSELDTVTDTSPSASSFSVSSGSDCEIEDDDEESPTSTSASNTSHIGESDDEEAVYHHNDHPQQQQQQEETVEEMMADLQRMTLASRAMVKELQGYRASNCREFERRLRQMQPMAL